MRSRRAYADPTAVAAMRAINSRPSRTHFDAKSRRRRDEVARFVGSNPGSDVRTIARALHLSRAVVIEHIIDLSLAGGVKIV